MTKTVAAAEFEAHSLELLDEVATTREEVVVTKEGKPVAKLVPVSSSRTRTVEELRAEGIKIFGDIVEPVADWEMTK